MSNSEYQPRHPPVTWDSQPYPSLRVGCTVLLVTCLAHSTYLRLASAVLARPFPKVHRNGSVIHVRTAKSSQYPSLLSVPRLHNAILQQTKPTPRFYSRRTFSRLQPSQPCRPRLQRHPPHKRNPRRDQDNAALEARREEGVEQTLPNRSVSDRHQSRLLLLNLLQ